MTKMKKARFPIFPSLSRARPARIAVIAMAGKTSAACGVRTVSPRVTKRPIQRMAVFGAVRLALRLARLPRRIFGQLQQKITRMAGREPRA